MTDRDPDPLPSLYEHAHFVRAIARRLSADPGTADDLVQETFVRTLGQDTPRVQSVRSWLATVVRNVFRDQRAAELARRQREQEVARRRASEGGDGDPFGIDQLSRALQALPPDYRHALQLRYYAQLSIEQMAAELGLPAATVKTRLHRGLKLLRVDLAARAGGEDRLRALLAPLVATPATAVVTGAALSSFVGVMMTKQAVGVALFVAAVFAWLAPSTWWREEQVVAVRPSASPPLAVGAEGPDVPPPVAIATRSEAAGQPAASERQLVAAGGGRVAGRLVYADTRQGVPFGRLEVRDAGRHEVVHTDAQGRFASEGAFVGTAELRTGGLASGDAPASREDEAEGPETAPPAAAVPVVASMQELLAGSATQRPDGAWVLPAGHPSPTPAPWHPIAGLGHPGDLEVPVALGPTFFVAMSLPRGYEAGDFRVALIGGAAIDVARLRRHGDANVPLGAATGGPAPFWCRVPPGSGPDGAAALCVWSDDGLWCAQAPVDTVHGVQPEPVTVELRPTGVVHGIVRDDTGTVRPGVAVTLVRADAIDVPTTGARTDERGHYRIPQVVPGVARLVVTGEQFEPWRHTVDVPAGSDLAHDIVLVARGIGGTLAGTITTASGERFPLCSVILTSRNDSSIWRTARIRWQPVGDRVEASFAFERVPVVECDVTLHTFQPCGVAVRSHRVTAPRDALAFHIEDRLPTVPVTFEVRAAGADAPLGEWSLLLTGDAGWQLSVDPVGAAAATVALPDGQPFVWRLVGAAVRSQTGRAVAGGAAATRIVVTAQPGYSVLLDGTDIANYYAARDVQVFADGVPVGATDADGSLVIDLEARPQRLTLDRRVWRVFDDGSHRSDIDGATGFVRARPREAGEPGARLHIYVQRVN